MPASYCEGVHGSISVLVSRAPSHSGVLEFPTQETRRLGSVMNSQVLFNSVTKVQVPLPSKFIYQLQHKQYFILIWIKSR